MGYILFSMAIVVSCLCSLPVDGQADPTVTLRGHMQPLGKQRAGPEDTIDEYPSGSLSSEVFYRKYVEKSRPVIIRGGAKDWPAFKLWTDEYLKATYGHLEVRLEEKVEGESNRKLPAGKFGIGRDTLEHFLSDYQDPDSNAYIVGELPSPMFKDASVIPCMACSTLYNKIQEVNFWLASKGAASAIHRDAFHSVNCLLNGTKEWYFMDSKYNDEVYVVNRAKYELGGLSLVNPKAVDLQRYPKFAKVKYAFLTVRPGDCLFVPGGYYHQVSSFGRKNMAVSVLFSQTPRNVEANTCSGVQQSKPLSEAGVYLPYPGTGLMRMGSNDIDMVHSIIENLTLANGDRFDTEVMVQVMKEMQTPAQGYVNFKDNLNEGEAETRQLSQQVFNILNTAKKPSLTAADLNAVSLDTWKEVIFTLEPIDVANTYDFEYSVISAETIMEGVEDHFQKEFTMTQKDWLQVYTEMAGGSEYFGLRVFKDLNPTGKDALSRDEVLDNLAPALERFEAEDPRLDISQDEAKMIRKRQSNTDHDDDDDDGFVSDEDATAELEELSEHTEL